MDRVTKVDLEQLVEIIADEGYFIEYAAGRPRLFLDIGGSVEEVSPRLPAREMQEWLNGFVKGLGEVAGNPGLPNPYPKESDWPSSLPFGEAHVGTWIDAAYGQNHAKDKLVGLLESIAELHHGGQRMPVVLESLIEELEEDDPERWYEVSQDAVDQLQSRTSEGYDWLWEAGDLILYPPDDE